MYSAYIQIAPKDIARKTITTGIHTAQLIFFDSFFSNSIAPMAVDFSGTRSAKNSGTDTATAITAFTDEVIALVAVAERAVSCAAPSRI